MNLLKRSKIKAYREEARKEEDDICPLLEVDFDTDYATRACLDHSHTIPRNGYNNSQCGRVRGVLSSTANMLLGRLEKLWYKYANRHTHITFSNFLRNVADYLERDSSQNPVHPAEVEKWKNRMKKWKVADIRKRLEKAGVCTKDAKLKKDVIDLYVEKIILPMYFEEK